MSETQKTETPDAAQKQAPEETGIPVRPGHPGNCSCDDCIALFQIYERHG